MHPITSCGSREIPRLAPAGWRLGPPREPGKGIPEMNGRGKSDRSVVPAKPSNQGDVAATPAAEGVEGRGSRCRKVVEVPVPENGCVRQLPEARYCTS